MIGIYDLIVGVAWPVAILIILLFLRKPIGNFLSKDEIEIETPKGTTYKLTSNKAAKTISTLFKDFIEVYNILIKDYQKEKFRIILSYANPPLVRDIYPNYGDLEEGEEKDKQVGCLRALRGIGLIVPEGGGSWEADKRILVTNFGKSLNEYIRSSL